MVSSRRKDISEAHVSSTVTRVVAATVALHVVALSLLLLFLAKVVVAEGAGVLFIVPHGDLNGFVDEDHVSLTHKIQEGRRVVVWGSESSSSRSVCSALEIT